MGWVVSDSGLSGWQNRDLAGEKTKDSETGGLDACFSWD